MILAVVLLVWWAVAAGLVVATCHHRPAPTGSITVADASIFTPGPGIIRIMVGGSWRDVEYTAVDGNRLVGVRAARWSPARRWLSRIHYWWWYRRPRWSHHAW